MTATTTTGHVRIDLRDHDACFSLRLPGEAVAAGSRAAGVELPTRIGARSAADDGSSEALCVGPDEWILRVPADSAAPIAEGFAGLDVSHSLVDISDREVEIAVEGDGAADILALGVPIDLARVAVDGGTRSVFDGVPVTLWRDGHGAFRLQVWRSFAPQLLALLQRGRLEVGLGV